MIKTNGGSAAALAALLCAQVPNAADISNPPAKERFTGWGRDPAGPAGPPLPATLRDALRLRAGDYVRFSSPDQRRRLGLGEGSGWWRVRLAYVSSPLDGAGRRTARVEVDGGAIFTCDHNFEVKFVSYEAMVWLDESLWSLEEVLAAVKGDVGGRRPPPPRREGPPRWHECGADECPCERVAAYLRDGGRTTS